MCVYKYTHIYTYTHVFVCTCVRVCVYGPVYIRIYGYQRSLLGGVLSNHPPGFLREGLIISLSDAHWLADQWVLVFCLSLSLQHWDCKNTSLCLAFPHGFWEWNSGLLASREALHQLSYRISSVFVCFFKFLFSLVYMHVYMPDCVCVCTTCVCYVCVLCVCTMCV